MPYVVISTRTRLECGPTVCGDEWSDPSLMAYLGAVLKEDAGNDFKYYSSPHAARVVLNKLEAVGYRVVTCAGPGQTCIWTLYKQDA